MYMLWKKAFLLYKNCFIIVSYKERKKGYAKIRIFRAITLKPSKKYSVNGIKNNKINQHKKKCKKKYR